MASGRHHAGELEWRRAGRWPPAPWWRRWSPHRFRTGRPPCRRSRRRCRRRCRRWWRGCADHLPGMPASTLPTMSPPTSAPLVKMPPPRRAKIEISEAPKRQRHQRIDHRAAGRVEAHRTGEEAEIERDAEKAEARDEKAGDRARLEGEVETAGQRLGRGLRDAHVGAHRDVHADEAGSARQHGADGRKPMAA